jgi:hypothetical protein
MDPATELDRLTEGTYPTYFVSISLLVARTFDGTFAYPHRLANESQVKVNCAN